MISALIKKELYQYLSSAVGYIVIFLFLVAVWLFCWVFPNSSFLNFGFAEMGTFFEICPYIMMFLAPALTMRLIVDEKSLGTFDWLLSKPISTSSIIVTKFAAALAMIFLALLLTSVFYFSLSYMASPKGNIDSGAVIGSYIALILLSALFLAIGIFSSTVSDNSIMAFIIALFLCFFMYEGLSQLAQIQSLPVFLRDFFDTISLSGQYFAMAKGVLDLKSVIYFLSFIVFFLWSSKTIIQTKS